LPEKLCIYLDYVERQSFCRDLILLAQGFRSLFKTGDRHPSSGEERPKRFCKPSGSGLHGAEALSAPIADNADNVGNVDIGTLWMGAPRSCGHKRTSAPYRGSASRRTVHGSF